MNKWKEKWGPAWGYLLVITCILAQITYWMSFLLCLAEGENLLKAFFNENLGGASAWMLVLWFNMGCYDK